MASDGLQGEGGGQPPVGLHQPPGPPHHTGTRVGVPNIVWVTDDALRHIYNLHSLSLL